MHGGRNKAENAWQVDHNQLLHPRVFEVCLGRRPATLALPHEDDKERESDGSGTRRSYCAGYVERLWLDRDFAGFFPPSKLSSLPAKEAGART